MRSTQRTPSNPPSSSGHVSWLRRAVVAALLASGQLLDARLAHADWGESWGSLVWGPESAVPVPVFDGLGFALLVSALVGAALALLLQRRRTRLPLVLLAAFALPAITWAATIGVPHVFMNGTAADADEVNANFDGLVTESNAQDVRIGALESQIQLPVDAATVDGLEGLALEESLEIDLDIATHAAEPAAHHAKYTDAEAFAAVAAGDGAGSGLDADLLDGMDASSIISAASFEVRTPISSLPVSIRSPGSYYLTGNLSGSGGGINVQSDDVTVDLMGFVIDGQGVADHGVDLSGHEGVTIRGGKIRGFGLAGIYQSDPASGANEIVGVQVLDNGTLGNGNEHSGIFLAGEYGLVESCTAVGNGGHSIFAGAGSTLANNVGEDIVAPGCPIVPPGCPASIAQRTPGQVFDDLQAAIDGENWTSFLCNYALDAFVLDDQGILVGHGDILAAEQSLVSLFSGVNAQLVQETEFRDTMRVLDSFDAGWVTIPDRTQTFVMECGLITRQTRHGEIVFTGPPPDQQ